MKHVFVSYVREDRKHVDELCSLLEAAKIPYWRDLKSISPGDHWKTKVSEAIRSGSLVFLACFSEESVSKRKSYMNEELTLAVEEFRLLPPEATWMIPVRFDDIEVPRWDLGAGRTIHDLNFSNLFGEDKVKETVALVAAIGKIMRIPVPDSLEVKSVEKILEAIGQSGGIRGAVEEMILDPQQAIKLDRLVSVEARRILASMRDVSAFPDSLRTGSNEDQIAELAETTHRYSELVENLCASFQVAARWGEVKALTPWISALKAIAGEASSPKSGHEVLHNLKYIPALMAIFTAALAATGQARWDTFKALLVDPIILRSDEYSLSQSLIQVVTPMRPFGGIGGLVPSVVARSLKHGEDARTALKVFTGKNSGEYRTPVAEWLHTLLQPRFADQYLDDAAYDSAFDRTELMLGLVSQDLANIAAEGDQARRWRYRSEWYGRSAWRATYGLGALGDLVDEVKVQGDSWPPLRAGLFGGKPDRVVAAFEGYKEDFENLGRRHF